jgi:hypothetical protein
LGQDASYGRAVKCIQQAIPVIKKTARSRCSNQTPQRLSFSPVAWTKGITEKDKFRVQRTSDFATGPIGVYFIYDHALLQNTQKLA